MNEDDLSSSGYHSYASKRLHDINALTGGKYREKLKIMLVGWQTESTSLHHTNKCALRESQSTENVKKTQKKKTG